jgi:hypothetical protein
MKLIKFASILVFALLLATCYTPVIPIIWTAAEKAAIDAAIALVSQTEIDSIFTDLNIIRHVTESSAAELLVVENAIMNRFTTYGLTTRKVPVTVSRVDRWDPVEKKNVPVTGTFTMNNLIAKRAGTDPGLEPVLVTAHWDSVPQTVGADDDISGCAGVIEIARVLQGVSLKRTVFFILFALEEDDYAGSQAYIKTMTRDPHVVINLDMIGFTSPVQNALPMMDVLLGWPAVGNFIGVVAADFSKDLALSYCVVAEAFVPALPSSTIGVDANLQNNPLVTDFMRSDHTSFWELGVPSIYLTDTSFLREGSRYHTVEDTVDKLDMAFLRRVIKATAALTALEAELN